MSGAGNVQGEYSEWNERNDRRTPGTVEVSGTSGTAGENGTSGTDGLAPPPPLYADNFYLLVACFLQPPCCLLWLPACTSLFSCLLSLACRVSCPKLSRVLSRLVLVLLGFFSFRMS